MARVIVLLYFILIKWSVLKFVEGDPNINAKKLNETETSIVGWAESFNSDGINTTSWPVKVDRIVVNGTNSTMVLRYGHQHTQKCKDFEKAFNCIQNCLHRGFQIAESDKQCKCSCLRDKTKAKYFDQIANTVSVPTTKMPYKYQTTASPTHTANSTNSECIEKLCNMENKSNFTTTPPKSEITSPIPKNTSMGQSKENNSTSKNATMETTERGNSSTLGNAPMETTVESKEGNSTSESTTSGTAEGDNSTSGTAEGGNSTSGTAEGGNSTSGTAEGGNSTSGNTNTEE